MTGRILPIGLEFKPFDYRECIIQIDEFGDWNVYEGKRHLMKFAHCKDAMCFVDNREPDAICLR